MVTNERQRLYAIDTRKGGKKAEKDSSVEAPIHQTSPATPVHDVDQHLQTALDPTLQRPAVQRHSPSTPTTTTVQTQAPNTTAPPASNPPALSLPTAPFALFSTDTVEPHLTNINIFLTYTSSTSKSIKLYEKRISTTRPAHLTFYNYTAFLEVISSMVHRAELLHPSVKTPQDNSTSETTSADARSSESLVGLAAAANALQPDKDEQQPQSAMGVEASGAKYTVKTVGTNGWQVIDSAESWYHVLTERAFATWADGVCNVIVELGGAHVQTVAREVDGVADTTEGEVQMEGA
ncbi:hypothetical protein BU25DRAFT_406062 [Macroventuria anomochaeta]|uniref:Uncharacterized protein n=1 Tax=Macroventuria anomochaeta TaxID=301207 RepID=A0ACB6SHK4_9PLEO|nr:uncharacterized protein BU25DRAFT_406062 [Macroventuria anomochaeta]KAF2632754.1 hypothetical protein BU25DRAFT_406062 [Macroventuria anomochaeta]